MTRERKLLRCKGVESDRRMTMIPIAVVISTSLWRSLRRRPFDSLGLQETSKANIRPAVSVFIMEFDVLALVVIMVVFMSILVMLVPIVVVLVFMIVIVVLVFMILVFLTRSPVTLMLSPHSVRVPVIMLYP